MYTDPWVLIYLGGAAAVLLLHIGRVALETDPTKVRKKAIGACLALAWPVTGVLMIFAGLLKRGLEKIDFGDDDPDDDDSDDGEPVKAGI